MAAEARPLPILGFGAGGHAKSLLEAVRSAGTFAPVALLDEDSGRAGSEMLGVPVLSEEGALERFLKDGVAHAFVGVGGTRDRAPRRRVFELLLGAGFELPPIVHAAAVVSPSARLGRGVQVLAAAVVNADAEIGDGAIVNTGAVVEHDCRIGAHAHTAPRAVLAGGVTIGTEAHIGIGAVVIEGVRVGTSAFVAAGAVVVNDVEKGVRVAGVPARELAATG